MEEAMAVTQQEVRTQEGYWSGRELFQLKWLLSYLCSQEVPGWCCLCAHQICGHTAGVSTALKRARGTHWHVEGGAG